MATEALIQISDEDLMLLGEEDEIRGNLTIKPPVVVLPDTERSAELKRKKMELLRKRREEQELERRRKEQEEAQRRLKEQEAKKLKQQQQQELKKKEEERKRREEEEQRAKMEGGLDNLLGQLLSNQSSSHLSVAGIELGSVRLRLLAHALEKNQSCQSIDLSRKGLNDEDGEAIAGLLKKNTTLKKVEMEGNNLGVKSAQQLAEALASNSTVKSLNLESNNLTSGGADPSGIIELARALTKGKSALSVLNVARNALAGSAGDAFADAAEKNQQLMVLDLTANDLTIAHLRNVDMKIQRNRELASESRKMERQQRFQMFANEFETRQYIMQVEAVRLETEAIQERRLTRMRERLLKWNTQQATEEREYEETLQDLLAEYEERKLSRKGKKGKKGKK